MRHFHPTAFHPPITCQVHVNEVWSATTGEPDQAPLPIPGLEDVEWTATEKTLTDNLVTVGNTVQVNGDTDIYVYKRNDSGQLLWERTFAGPAGGNDYGVAVTLDENQNIIVAGVVSLSDLTTDIVVLKYSSTGTLLWSAILPGTSGQFDIATKITRDGSNNIYVAGFTIDPVSRYDWTVTKLSSSGNQLWNTTYDHAGFNEIPLKIKPVGTNKISVRGLSNSTATEWDFANVRFNANNGSVVAANRQHLSDLSALDAVSIDSDSSNIYIAATVFASEGDKDIQLMKLDENFQIEWTRNIDGEGLDDVAKTIKVDNAGDIVVAGNSLNGDGGTEILISKFSANGVEIFSQNIAASQTFEKATVTSVDINWNNDIAIVGSIEKAGNTDFITTMYSTEGIALFSKDFGGIGASIDVATGVDFSTHNSLIVTGTLDDGKTSYGSVQYNWIRSSGEVVYLNGKPNHIAREVIVNFHPQYVNTAFVDNPKYSVSSIHEVLTSEAVDSIGHVTGINTAHFAKIYSRLTTTDTISITRLGDTISMPKFWSSLLVIFPETSAESYLDLDNVIAELEQVTGVVSYGTYNHYRQLDATPNDYWFNQGSQSSLTPTTQYPNAHINVEPAWNIETGRPHTKVGVIDAMVYREHEDFKIGTSSRSIVTDGYDYVGRMPLRRASVLHSHGTAVGGIIGANRNNDLGIAGIAGGGPDDQGEITDGIRITSLGITGILNNRLYGISTTAIVDALLEGASDMPNQSSRSFGLDILNCSFGGSGSNPEELKQVKFAWKNNCLIVAARGNNGNDASHYPASYNDEYLISVGGSGTNGLRNNGSNGNNWLPFGFNDGSSYGGTMDVIAPSADENVLSLIDPDNPLVWFDDGINFKPPPVGTKSNYQQFNGTSAAAPHVAGIAALMHSVHHESLGQPNSLAPEDYENIIQKYAKSNLDVNGHPMYDDFIGWGLVDAHGSVLRVEGPEWYVLHRGDNPINTTTSYEANLYVAFEDGAIEDYPGGTYYVDRTTVTHTYRDILPQTATIIDRWERLSSTTGVSATEPVTGETMASFAFTNCSGNTCDVSVTTHTYLIRQDPSGTHIPTVLYVPAPPNEIAAGYSLHVFEKNTSTSSIDRSDEWENTLTITPNPTNFLVTVKYDKSINLADDKSFAVYNVNGIQVDHGRFPPHTNSHSLDVGHLISGTYFFKLITGEGTIVKKFIKK